MFKVRQIGYIILKKTNWAPSGILSYFFNAKNKTFCLTAILILAQILLLSHVAQHQLEEAFSLDNDHCVYCAVGGHAAPAIVPPILPILSYTLVQFLAFGIVSVVGFSLSIIRVRGPPSSIG